MPRQSGAIGTTRRYFGRAAAVAAAAVLLTLLPLQVSQAEDGGDTATDQAVQSATDNAASNAAEQAAATAADQAASSAADQASSSAADQAASSAADQAAASAADQAASSAADQAASSAADQAASDAADQAASNAADNASQAASDQAASDAADNATQTASDQAESTASEKAAETATDQAEASAASRAEDSQSETASERSASAAAERATNSEDGGGPADRTAEQASSGDKTASTAENKSESGTNGKPDDESASNAANAGAAGTTREADLERVTEQAPIDVGRDVDGNAMRANELVVMLSESDDKTIRAMGYNITGQAQLGSLGGELVRIRVAGMATPAEALAAIQRAVPDAVAAANHLYREAGKAASLTAYSRHRAKPDPSRASNAIVGVVDTPVDRTYPDLDSAVVASGSFANGSPVKTVHGTAVAELIARQKVRLAVANVFAADTLGEDVATTDAIVAALDWLVSKGVPVINMSIEGPDNAAIREAIRRAEAKGTVIVAAAGNDGPAAPPAYPAALPGVVAVTAIDNRDQIYRYANRGSYISFAAPGVDVETALPPNGVQKSSGTSFAAPVVAGLIARLTGDAKDQTPQAVLHTLVKSARHLGAPGRNPVFGYGALDAGAAAALQARNQSAMR